MGEGIVSYGLSSYGYDIRVANEFKIFSNVNYTAVDPKAFDNKAFVDIVTDDVCIIPPNSFALARTVEYFRIPRDVITLCIGKSTYARLWHHLERHTLRARLGRFCNLEISNTTPLPAKIYANEGIGQVLFLRGSEECEISYSDRKGKYNMRRVSSCRASWETPASGHEPPHSRYKQPLHLHRGFGITVWIMMLIPRHNPSQKPILGSAPSGRSPARSLRTPDTFRILIHQLFESVEHDLDDIEQCMVACVVPELREPLESLCPPLLGRSPLFLGPGLKSGLRIRTESPRELGPDRIANALAAREIHGRPAAVFDFGTALTLDLIDDSGDYIGAIIAPGIHVAARALAKRTARLSEVDLVAPDKATAQDTVGGLRAGLVFGYLGLIEGLAKRIQAEIGPAAMIATGDAPWLPAILQQTEIFDHYDRHLSHRGLRLVHLLNR